MFKRVQFIRRGRFLKYSTQKKVRKNDEDLIPILRVWFGFLVQYLNLGVVYPLWLARMPTTEGNFHSKMSGTKKCHAWLLAVERGANRQ